MEFASDLPTSCTERGYGIINNKRGVVCVDKAHSDPTSPTQAHPHFRTTRTAPCHRPHCPWPSTCGTSRCPREPTQLCSRSDGWALSSLPSAGISQFHRLSGLDCLCGIRMHFSSRSIIDPFIVAAGSSRDHIKHIWAAVKFYFRVSAIMFCGTGPGLRWKIPWLISVGGASFGSRG